MNSIEWIKHPAVRAQITYSQKRDLEKQLAELQAKFDDLDAAWTKVAIAMSQAQAQGTVGTVNGQSLWNVYVEAEDSIYDAEKAREEA